MIPPDADQDGAGAARPASPATAMEVAAALIFRGGRLLIAQRPAGSHLAGLWEFPGGKREPNETWEECLRRELREELEVDAAVEGLFEEVEFQYPEKRIRLRFYIAKLVKGEPVAKGCADVRWVDRAGLSAHAFPPADEALLERLRGAADLWERS
jgi:8-oxo-dGTP diphosphatase